MKRTPKTIDEKIRHRKQLFNKNEIDSAATTLVTIHRQMQRIHRLEEALEEAIANNEKRLIMYRTKMPKAYEILGKTMPDFFKEPHESSQCPICGDYHNGKIPLGCQTGDGV